MRFVRLNEPGAESRLAILEGAAEIGYIRDGVVGFRGFLSREDATTAAGAAHRALEQRRARGARLAGVSEEYLVWERQDGLYVIAASGLVARLVPPKADDDSAGWGFEVQLLPDEDNPVFAMSRARTMWNAIRWAGVSRRMRQFRPDLVLHDEPETVTTAR